MRSNDEEAVREEVRKAEQRGEERVKATGEVFTPMSLARKMVAEIAEEKKRNPQSTFLDRFLWVRNDPRTTDLATVPDKDDTRRFCRFVQSVFDRFVLSEEPSVPSLWLEDGQLLCGWNDLFPDDGREVPTPEFTGQRVWKWDGVPITKPEEWRWRVPKRD
jgi:hypothetical protein